MGKGVLPERIAVVDSSKKYLSNTNPARARKLLKSGKAKIFSKNPFVLELIPEGEQGEKRMKKPIITNFTHYFSGEERDVYIQNISNNQISIQFEVGPGRYESVLVPRSRRPLNLTQHIPFDAIKRSTDIRKLVNRRPPVLQLMTAEEYNKFYEDMAKSMGTTIDQEVEKSLELQAALMDRRVPEVEKGKETKSIDELEQERNDDPEAAAEMQPIPRVIGLCAQVGPDVPQTDKPQVAEMMSELETLEGEMRPTDFEYLASKGHYKAIKKWAMARLEKSQASSED